MIFYLVVGFMQSSSTSTIRRRRSWTNVAGRFMRSKGCNACRSICYQAAYSLFGPTIGQTLNLLKGWRDCLHPPAAKLSFSTIPTSQNRPCKQFIWRGLLDVVIVDSDPRFGGREPIIFRSTLHRDVQRCASIVNANVVARSAIRRSFFTAADLSAFLPEFS